MKIRIPRQDLLEAVNKVKTVVSPKSALPILSHILIEAEDNSLKLSATDLKVSIECTVDCTVTEPGSLTVSSQRLSSILTELPEGEISLDLAGNNVINLQCGKIKTKLFSMSADEFPPVRTFEGVEPLVMDQKVLKKMFQKTSFAICSDQARYNLTGLLCELADGKFTAVATDGRRMSLYSEKEGIPKGVNIKVIIPGKMITELERLLSDSGEVQVFLDESQAAFQFDSLRLVTALIEGNFPNYDMVIPKKHDKEGVILTSTFMEAMRRTRTMTNDKFNSVRVTVNGPLMTLNVVTPEVGEYEEELECEFDGGAIDIAFNPDFVIEVLRRIETEKLSLVLKDGSSPGLLKPFEEKSSHQYLNVIMPIRI
ncbi:MAG: DNA polymerase III subunit beta [Candidatus Hydrogenedentes bacterium]|nr:DNA polymerase III subunit beta [Candidatus Hydrogenedentota bacterium]